MATIKHDIEVKFHSSQREFFFTDRDIRFKVLHKGRRWGFTRGAMQYCILGMLGDPRATKPGTNMPYSRILWGDTINSNIARYIERYALPLLNQLPDDCWNWKKVRRELHIKSDNGTWSVMDFRSADTPERWEGFGYDLMILNEAGIILKDSYLWENAVLPMTIDYQSQLIIGGTPKGKKDKKRMKEKGIDMAVFYELAQKGTPSSPLYAKNHKTYIFTSYDNKMLSKELIDDLASNLPASVREQEIEGKFVDEISGDVFMREWWNYYEATEMPRREDVIALLISWDTAYKKNQENDFSVATVWAVTVNEIFLIDMWRARVKFPDLKKNAIALSEAYNPQFTLIEDKATGSPLADEFEEGTRLAIKRINPTQDKLSRAVANTPEIEAGKVRIPHPTWKPWVLEFIEEHAEFPAGEYDDIVDSTSQALTYIKANIKADSEGIVVRRGDD